MSLIQVSSTSRQPLASATARMNWRAVSGSWSMGCDAGPLTQSPYKACATKVGSLDEVRKQTARAPIQRSPARSRAQRRDGHARSLKRAEEHNIGGIGLTTRASGVAATPATITSAARTHRRSPAGILASVAAAALIVVINVSPAHAEFAQATLDVAGYGVTAYATVECNDVTQTMDVSARTSTMEARNWLGAWISGPYDNGQWVRYDVLARDISVQSWTEVYTWSPWYWISTLTWPSPDMPDMHVTVPAELGSNRVSGAALHDFEVMVQVDWWTGQDNVASIPTTYSEALPFPQYFYINVFSTTRCVF